jgi:hypothetical protein
MQPIYEGNLAPMTQRPDVLANLHLGLVTGMQSNLDHTADQERLTTVDRFACCHAKLSAIG